jgi:hypothetical protein
MFRQHLLIIRVYLNLPFALHSGAFEAEIESTDTSE